MNHLRLAALVLLSSTVSLAAVSRSARAADLPPFEPACPSAIASPDLTASFGIPEPAFLSECTVDPEETCREACYLTYKTCINDPGCTGACQTACHTHYVNCLCNCPSGGPPE